MIRIKILSFLLIAALVVSLPNAACAEQTTDMNDTASPLLSAYRLIRNLGTIFASVGLAAYGIELILGNSASAEKTGKRILLLFIAVIGLWMLPLFISIGTNLFGNGWIPESMK